MVFPCATHPFQKRVNWPYMVKSLAVIGWRGLGHKTMILPELGRFLVVGTVGFIIDAGLTTVLILGTSEMSPFVARVPAIAVAILATWLLNRFWTFAGGRHRRPAGQAILYIAAQAVSQTVNYLVYAGLISTGAVFLEFPALAVAAGSIVALVMSFALGRQIVFASGRRSAEPR